MVKYLVSSDEDSSDDELDGPVEQAPIAVGWVKVDEEHSVGISSLPGCVYGGLRRSLRYDVDYLRDMGIQESFVLCPFSELRAMKVRNLMWELDEVGINVHHAPINPAADLDLAACNKILDDLQEAVLAGKSTVLHCLHGCGRSSVMAALLILRLNSELSADTAIDIVRNYYGPSAICSVRQYNFMREYQERVLEQEASQAAAAAAA
eukprot:scpid96631/ scgid22364/ Cyclin-dependent kinase inhibitor 3; CDK2-associated dual-specificity phosphatase; Cyclin-dependent kinase interactor 1; Cyclin-dependent kinase-interacting protein 2; Kinase-associated phosphatase